MLVLLLVAGILITACSGTPTAIATIPASTATIESVTVTPEPSPTPDAFQVTFDGALLAVPPEACNSAYAGLIRSVAATDAHTVAFTLCRPDAAFLFRVALPAFSIYPSEWIASTAADGARTADALEHPIGTGPYQVSDWTRGESITLTANPDYWGGSPAVSKLIIRWSADPEARLAELQAGIVDGIDNVNPKDYETVRSDALLALLERPALNSLHLDAAVLVPLADAAHALTAVAYRADVSHPQASALGYEMFSRSAPGGRDAFIWLQATEPASLFCADEWDADALRICAQVNESLYRLDSETGTVEPALAEACTPNNDKTVWTCALRQNVKFQDGSDFDAADVVATFNMGLNPDSSSHAGSTNQWKFYDAFWGLMKTSGN